MVSAALAPPTEGAIPKSHPGEKSSALVYAIIPIWLFASLPIGPLGYVAIMLAIILPVLRPNLAALLLLTSFLFYSTMNVPANVLYALRVYWICVALFFFVVLRQEKYSRLAWLTWLIMIALVGYGVLVGSIRTGNFMAAYRNVFLEASLAVLWFSCLFIGYSMIYEQGGALRKHQLYVLLLSWVISVAYGVAQSVFGLSEATVPPDVWPYIAGFQQYEELGRRPFSFPTSNGICVASLMVMPLLVNRRRAGAFWISTIFTIGLLVGVLTVTRSYAPLLLLLILGYGFLYSRRRGLTVVYWLGAIGTLALILAFVEVESIKLALRLSGASVGGTRLEIWTYFVDNMTPTAWLFGNGFGSNGWYEFFGSWHSFKQLLSPHSSLLELTGQFGLLGLLFYTATGVILIRSFFVFRGTWIGPGVVIAMGLIFLREQISASYIISPSVLSGIFWVLAGMLIAQLDIIHTRRPANSRTCDSAQ